MTRDPVYTHGHHESVLRSHSWRTAENSAGYLLPHLRAGDQLLDVGCGPGTITVDLATRVAPGRVVGLDRSEDVLDTARSTAEHAGVREVEFATGDVQSLAFADGTFDVVHAHQVLQHVTDPVGALREMRRVSRPGGIVAARDSDYLAMTWFPAIPDLDEWLALYRRIAGSNGGEPDAGRRLKSWAHSAGFVDVTATASTWCFADDSDRQWWADMWADRMTHSAFAEQAVADGQASTGDLSRLADGWRRWSRETDGWFSVLHGEIICRA